jgi:hypothetical protein
MNNSGIIRNVTPRTISAIIYYGGSTWNRQINFPPLDGRVQGMRNGKIGMTTD